MNKIFLAGVIVLLISVGFALGRFFTSKSSNPIVAADECITTSEFINPQLGCGATEVIEKRGYAELIGKLNELIAEEKQDGVVEGVSIYFRDLNNGPSFGINEQETFIPASLFKLPIMLAYYVLVDENNVDLATKIAYGETNSNEQPRQFYPPKEEVKPHTPYTLDDLISRMIIYSDNKATEALVSDLRARSAVLGKDLIIETYNSTGIIYTESADEAVITVKSYASLYRILYNSSYLSIKMSDKALSLLSRADFKKGLAAGVPKDLKVAHKFGERFDDKVEDDVEQFHDCGIVYYPKNPYLICVMTKGRYIPTLVSLTAKISEMVYQEVDSRKIE